MLRRCCQQRGCFCQVAFISTMRNFLASSKNTQRGTCTALKDSCAHRNFKSNLFYITLSNLQWSKEIVVPQVFCMHGKRKCWLYPCQESQLVCEWDFCICWKYLIKQKKIVSMELEVLLKGKVSYPFNSHWKSNVMKTSSYSICVQVKKCACSLVIFWPVRYKASIILGALQLVCRLLFSLQT